MLLSINVIFLFWNWGSNEMDISSALWILMIWCFMPRSHQTRSQYVIQNVVEWGQTVCERNERCDNCLESFCEFNGRFMDAVDGIKRVGHSRTSRLLKILRRPSRSEIWWSDNVLKNEMDVLRMELPYFGPTKDALQRCAVEHQL